MQRKNNFKSVLLIFLMIFGIFWKHCDSQVNREEANTLPDDQGGDNGAFFALRSCHQLLQGDSGAFFSPDYLCSNPPLWCNWTIQVDPRKRIHLHLEDMTPDDTCHLKQDQVHVDEPTGRFRGHKVLQKCWHEAKYTSFSNTLHVVLLIGGWPSPLYRGFYGRYQAFGPPVLYEPQEGFKEQNRKSEPLGHMDLNEFDPVLNGAPSPANSDLMYDYYDQPSAVMPELPWEPEENTDSEVGENHHPALENHNDAYQFTAVPTVPAPTQGTSRWEKRAVQTPSGRSDSTVHPEYTQQQHGPENQELQPTKSIPTAEQSNVEEASVLTEEAAVPEDEGSTRSLSEGQKVADGSEQAAEGENRTEVSEGEREDAEQTHPHPNMLEPLSEHRRNLNVRNHSEIPHLPGDPLFEVAVEVNLSEDLKESWDNLVRSLLLSVKSLISKQLEALHTPLSMSSKRIKRLSAGVLYILWLQIGQGPGGPHVHRAVHSELQGLISRDISVGGNNKHAVITSVSTADVNECQTHLVLCDLNADCVNQFGSYSCRCRPGFQDKSRQGSGGTVCVDVHAAGCSSGLSAESKGVYVLFFLLSSLLLMLLAAAALLYHRHHRGAFLVRCHSDSSMSPPDLNNNHHHDDIYSTPADSDLPPPPPPVRGFREDWPQIKERRPAMDLPLLRFSPLLPPDGYREPQEGGKM
ncbi:uncharacterized protein zgc:66455 isoform X1 [Micropterus dolomieu]|uniref:uncharacterized protein zgc:66455 isoform X1 n=1 Tax=Micropterus dolomieu TaxID=147949 RepID=UPI001E8E9959|nr:uncharacterized protein zgc:66455 isoform X1 [Micropterus dolomieu]